jgi:hypothetical protein
LINQGPTASGYAGLASRPQPSELPDIEQIRLDLTGRAEPIGRVAHEFREFGIYNAMIYTRAEMMYGALRDVLGDSAFAAFLRLYYDRWKLKHVDERAMRRAAEDAAGRDLGWFFEQWVHRTGLVDYTLAGVRTRREGDAWVTRARVVRRGAYRHPMPVGARVGDHWVIARAEALKDKQWVELRTAERPAEVRLDPLHVAADWDTRNDVRRRFPYDRRVEHYVPDWPFLEQAERRRAVIAFSPFGWYTTPGGATLGVRTRSNYLGFVDRNETGVAIATHWPSEERLQFWYTFENPRLGRRPAMGWRFGAWFVDGGGKLELRKRWDASPFTYARGPTTAWTATLDATLAPRREWIDSARWDPNADVVDLGVEYRRRAAAPDGPTVRAFVLGGYRHVGDLATGSVDRLFARAEAEATVSRRVGARLTASARGFAGASDGAPRQRSLGVSALDATETFENHLLRGRGAPLARRDVHYVALGGAGLRGYSPLLRPARIAAANLEGALRIVRPAPAARRPELLATLFGDLAAAGGGDLGAPRTLLADAGIGLALRGPFFDRTVRLRLDAPLYVRHPEFAVNASAGDGPVRFRWMFSFRDLW